MPSIKNKLFQPLMILLSGNKALYLQPRGEANVSTVDLGAPHLKSMIERGSVATMGKGAPTSDLTAPVEPQSKKPKTQGGKRHA